MNLYSDRLCVINLVIERHGGQSRAHGGPFYLHPIATTEILHDILGVRDRTTLVTSDCHDLLETTRTTYDELRSLYGEQVANDVQTLTNPNRITFRTEQQRREATLSYYLSLQQASETARIVKVADRIHNLTELPFTSREHQYVYLADTMCLMECLKNYIEQWQFDKLQHFWWQALRQYVQGDSSGKRMANVPASV